MTTTEIEERHNLASRFYKFCRLMAKLQILEKPLMILRLLLIKNVADMVVEPGGLIDFGAHYTKIPLFHNWSISRSYYWQEHLFELKKFEMPILQILSVYFGPQRYSRAARELLAKKCNGNGWFTQASRTS
ncbi:MAG: hypothetical protein U0401_22020 [Anaerolineae bacterium]